MIVAMLGVLVIEQKEANVLLAFFLSNVVVFEVFGNDAGDLSGLIIFGNIHKISARCLR